MGQQLGLAQTGCLPPQLAHKPPREELNELREMYNIIVQYRSNRITREELGEHFPGLVPVLDVEMFAGEEFTNKKMDDFLKGLTFDKFVATLGSHYSDVSAGAFVAETLSEDRRVEVDANDIDLVSIFKYYDNDDNGTVDLREVKKALLDLHRVSQRAYEDYPAWNDEDFSEEIISAQIQKIRAQEEEHEKEIR